MGVVVDKHNMCYGGTYKVFRLQDGEPYGRLNVQGSLRKVLSVGPGFDTIVD